VELEVVAGEDGGGGERLERALRDTEVIVLQEIHTSVDERGHLGRREALSRSFEKLVEALHARHPLLRVLRA